MTIRDDEWYNAEHHRSPLEALAMRNVAREKRERAERKREQEDATETAYRPRIRTWRAPDDGYTPPENKAKTLLGAYRMAILRRESLTREYTRVREAATRSTQALSEDGAHGGGGEADRMGGMACRLAELSELLSDAAREQNEAANEALALIAAVRTPAHRTLLMLRYLERIPWAQIAEQMHYSERWVKHLHGQALMEANRWLERQNADREIQPENF